MSSLHDHPADDSDLNSLRDHPADEDRFSNVENQKRFLIAHKCFAGRICFVLQISC
jgi:hypothetical protein